MPDEALGVIINGATSGIANRQRLAQALLPIWNEGGLRVGDRVVRPPLLVGRAEHRLRQVADRFGLDNWSTDFEAALANSDYPVFFDAGFTGNRAKVLRAALMAGKHIYSEKPVVADIIEGRDLQALAAERGLKFGVVEDKLSMPGLTKLRLVAESGFLGRIVNFRIEFGWWIFSHPEARCSDRAGTTVSQKAAA